MASHSIQALLFSLIQKYMTLFNSIHILFTIINFVGFARCHATHLQCRHTIEPYNTILILQIVKVLF